MHHARSGPFAFVEHRAPGREGRSLPPLGPMGREGGHINICLVVGF